MKLETNKQVWGARALGWIVVFVVACGILFGSTFMLGPTLFSSDAVGQKIAMTYYCPGAVDSVEARGPSRQVTTDPTGPYGHTVEITCTFADGSTKIISNEEYAVTAVAGMFGGGALCGAAIALPMLLVPFFLFRKKKSS